MIKTKKHKPRKPARCAICREPFFRSSSLIRHCSPDCGVELWKQKQAKEYRAETARRKKALLDKCPKHWTKKAVASCNRYVRERDRFEPCISCGATEAAQWDAGHYVPAGRGSVLRFDADRNIHKQCCTCNDGNKRSGNLIGYRPALVKKLGLEVVEELERIGHQTKRWTVEELKAIVADYDARLAVLTRERAFG